MRRGAKSGREKRPCKKTLERYFLPEWICSAPKFFTIAISRGFEQPKYPNMVGHHQKLLCKTSFTVMHDPGAMYFGVVQNSVQN